MDYKEIMPNRHLYHIPSSKLASLDCEDCRASYGPSGGGEITPLLRAEYLGGSGRRERTRGRTET